VLPHNGIFDEPGARDCGPEAEALLRAKRQHLQLSNAFGVNELFGLSDAGPHLDDQVRSSG
jgi:hypothetical protein